MTENPPQEDPDDTPISTEQSVSKKTEAEEQAITRPDLPAVQEGDAIAVRAVKESRAWILAGQVTSFADDAETKQAIERRVEESTSTVVLSIDADTWWDLSEDESLDRSHELDDRPQMQEYPGMPPKDPPACSLSYWKTGRIGLQIPMPVHNGSRVIYYTANDYGRVVALTHGAVVRPELLLPDGYSPP